MCSTRLCWNARWLLLLAFGASHCSAAGDPLLKDQLDDYKDKYDVVNDLDGALEITGDYVDDAACNPEVIQLAALP